MTGVKSWFWLPNKHFLATLEGEWGRDDASIHVTHDSDRPEKRRAEVAVLLANFIRHARDEYGFTPEEINGWAAMQGAGSAK